MKKSGSGVSSVFAIVGAILLAILLVAVPLFAITGIAWLVLAVFFSLRVSYWLIMGVVLLLLLIRAVLK